MWGGLSACPGVRMSVWQYCREADLFQVHTAVCPEVTCLCVSNQQDLPKVSDKAKTEWCMCPVASWIILHYIGPNIIVLKAFYTVHQYHPIIYFLTAFPENNVTNTGYFQFAFKKFYKLSSGHFKSPHHHTGEHFAMALSRGIVTVSLTDASLSFCTLKCCQESEKLARLQS